LNFDCTANPTDGRASLVVVPDLAKVAEGEVIGQLPIAGQVSRRIFSPYAGDLRGLSREAATDTASTTPIMLNVTVVGIST
jgi:hypothetical protein